MKDRLLRVAQSTGLFELSRRASRKSLRILAYHGLWTTSGYQYGDRVFISPEQFEQRMTWLKTSGYPVLPLDDAVRRLNDGSLPDHSVVITIDDGWSSTYTHMLPILEALDLPATVYVTTWYSEHQLPVINVAVDYLLRRAGQSPSAARAIFTEIEQLSSLTQREEALREHAARLGTTTEEWWEGRQFHLMSTDEIREAGRRGMDIQLHTHRHSLCSADVGQLEREIADNRAALARACGKPEQSFTHFCYPCGVADPSSAEVLKANGVRSATLADEGINPQGANPYGLRRFLDGRSTSEIAFQAYLSGTLAAYRAVRNATELLPRLSAVG